MANYCRAVTKSLRGTTGFLISPNSVQGLPRSSSSVQGFLTFPSSVHGCLTSPSSVQGFLTFPSSVDGYFPTVSSLLPLLYRVSFRSVWCLSSKQGFLISPPSLFCFPSSTKGFQVLTWFSLYCKEFSHFSLFRTGLSIAFKVSLTFPLCTRLTDDPSFVSYLASTLIPLPKKVSLPFSLCYKVCSLFLFCSHFFLTPLFSLS